MEETKCIFSLYILRRQILSQSVKLVNCDIPEFWLNVHYRVPLCTVYTVHTQYLQYTQFTQFLSVHSTVYTVSQCTLYIQYSICTQFLRVHCTFSKVYVQSFSVYCTEHITYSIHSTVYKVSQCTLYSVQCKQYIQYTKFSQLEEFG